MTCNKAGMTRNKAGMTRNKAGMTLNKAFLEHLSLLSILYTNNRSISMVRV